MKLEQLVVGPDGGVLAPATDAHRQRVPPFAINEGLRKPARSIPPQAVLAVFPAFFGVSAIPTSGHSSVLKMGGDGPSA